MNTVNSNADAARSRRVMRWAAITAAVAAAFAAGMLTAQSFSSAASHPKTAVNSNVRQPADVASPALSEIVPSAVIDTNQQMFFGTGDGSAGYYADRPAR